MKIRLARNEDYAEAARLHRQTIRSINSKDYPADIIRVWSGQNKAQRFRASADKCKRWVAIEDSKIIGFCDHNFKCELWGLYVHKDHINQNVGSSLLKVAESSMWKQGCKKITVKSTITAKKFYEKNGYDFFKKAFHKIKNKKVSVCMLIKNSTKKRD